MNNNQFTQFVRIVCAIGVLALLLICLGCSYSVVPNNSSGPNKHKERSVGFNAEYVRDNGPFTIGELELVYIFNSYDEYLEHLYDDGNLSSQVYEGSSIGMDEIMHRYTETWFKEHQLLVFGMLENSGSIRFNVDKLWQASDIVIIDIERIVPSELTADLAGWEVLIEIERCIPEGSEFMLNIHNKMEY